MRCSDEEPSGSWRYRPVADAVGLAAADLAMAVPALRPVLDRHLEPGGDILSTFLMSDLSEALVPLIEAGDDASVTGFLAGVERLAASANVHERNLVIVSFLEDHVLGGKRATLAYASVRHRLGPATRELLAELEQAH